MSSSRCGSSCGQGPGKLALFFVVLFLTASRQLPVQSLRAKQSCLLPAVATKWSSSSYRRRRVTCYRYIFDANVCRTLRRWALPPKWISGATLLLLASSRSLALLPSRRRRGHQRAAAASAGQLAGQLLSDAQCAAASSNNKKAS